MSSSDAPVKRVDRTIWLWGLGYFIAYTPYAGLVKAMSAGKLPGLAGIDGLERPHANYLYCFSLSGIPLTLCGHQ